jgi:hypothetical protein
MYTRAQKESSSVSPTSIHKKSNSSDGERSFSVQRQQDINSSQEKERPSYSRNAADSLIANVMRSMAAREQGEEAQGHKSQEESGAASVAQVVMPKPELPIAPATSVCQPLGEMGIQRQCSACQQAMEVRKDSDEMSSVAGVQTKLTVGAVGDRYEQEADRVAAQVMRMSVAPDNSPQVQRFGEEDNPVLRWSLAQSITPVVHRRVDEQVQMRSQVQRAFQAGGNEASGDLESRLNASKGRGSALAPEVRAFMEPRFGADFSSVRVHTGGEAVQMNRELGAQAFAHGSDVYFGAGKSPGNNELTAHELTHVVQQTRTVQREEVSEREAGTLEQQPLLEVGEEALQKKEAEVIQRQGGQNGKGPTQQDINRAMSEIAKAKAIVNNPDAPLLDDERSNLKAKIASAEAKLSEYTELSNQGSTRQAVMAPLALAGGGVLADDATGVGVADDFLLPLIGIGMLVTYLATRSPASDQELANSWSQVTSSLEAVAVAGTGLIVLKINGDKIRGNTERLAEHLARLLRLDTVGGVPSGEPPSPNNDDDPHWWTEIKAFLKNIASGIGKASRKQVMRELMKKYTEEQILEIQRRLIEAAKKMGENPPPFLPPP